MATPTVVTGSLPFGIHAEATGKFVYVSNVVDQTISQFDIGVDGSLTIKTTPTVASGTNARTIVTHVSYE